LFQQPIRLHKTGGKFRPLKIVREWKTGFSEKLHNISTILLAV